MKMMMENVTILLAGLIINNAANENRYSLIAVLACNQRKSIFVGTHLAVLYRSTKCDYRIYIYVIRSAPEQDDATTGGVKKRLRLGSIYDYRKLTVLGEGRDGVVFKAEHLRTGDMVAIKWVRAAADQRAFIREVGCLAACRGHRNIVVVRDVVEDASTGDMFIVTDFVGGRTLRLDLWMTHPDPEERARSVMRDLVAAAVALHAAGVMHRDIKPDNVLVANGGGLKLCDFGAATPVKPPGKPYEESRVGTLLYTSPEQLADSEFYGPAVDMWALGCIMAEILTGGPLFDDSSEERMHKEMADMRHRLESTGTCKLFDELPELSAAGREVLAGMLAFNPDERMTAAEALDHRWFTGKPERRS
uniref:[RNA-polymerase]-subunit kinase n=1 Tax=Oryza nivara TaxID=4536 RepID=A0A0E0IP83_ORYNI